MPFSWTQDAAVSELKALIAEIPRLRTGQRFSADHTGWVMRTLAFLEQVFGQNSRYYLSFATLRWKETGQVMIGGPGDPGGGWNPQAALERVDHRAFLRHLDAAEGFLQAALDDLQRRGISDV